MRLALRFLLGLFIALTLTAGVNAKPMGRFNAVSYLSVEAKALRAATTVKPPLWWSIFADQAVIRPLKGAGVWGSTVFWYSLIAPDSQVAYLNWKTPATSATTEGGGTWTFTAWQGAHGDGSTSYLDSSYLNNTSPASNGSNKLGMLILSEGSNDYDMGTATTENVRFGVRNSSTGAMLGRFNTSAGFTTSGTYPTTVGHWSLQQDNTDVDMTQYRETNPFSTQSNITASVDNTELCLACNIAGTSSAKTYGTWYNTAALTTAQHLIINNALYEWTRAVTGKTGNARTNYTTWATNPFKSAGNGNTLPLQSGVVTAQNAAETYSFRYMQEPTFPWQRFELRSGDTASGGERSEWRSNTAWNNGVDNWVHYQFYIEEGAGYASGWNIPGQWHATDAASVDGPIWNASIRDDGKITFHVNLQTSSGGGTTGTTLYTSAAAIAEGTWHTVIAHIKAVPSSASGNVIEIWFDGTKVVDSTQRFGTVEPCGSGETGCNYWKIGMYRGPAPSGVDPIIIYYANNLFGTTDLTYLLTEPLPYPW